MKTVKEQNPPISAEVLVLERLMGHTRIMRKGSDPALAEAAARMEQKLARELEQLKPAA